MVKMINGGFSITAYDNDVSTNYEDYYRIYTCSSCGFQEFTNLYRTTCSNCGETRLSYNRPFSAHVSRDETIIEDVKLQLI